MNAFEQAELLVEARRALGRDDLFVTRQPWPEPWPLAWHDDKSLMRHYEISDGAGNVLLSLYRYWVMNWDGYGYTNPTHGEWLWKALLGSWDQADGETDYFHSMKQAVISAAQSLEPWEALRMFRDLRGPLEDIA